jgi:hypothetical protein
VAHHKNETRRIAFWPLTFLFAGFALAGCAAAAIPLTAAQVGIGGFEAYKMVGTSTGGSVGVAFPKNKDGKEIAPQPLPPVGRVAVWPDGEDELHVAEKLMASKRFTVVTPGHVRVILAEAKISPNLNELTPAEQANALATVCRRAKADMVLASLDAGSIQKSNGLSFLNPQKITRSDLVAFSCSHKTIVWRDRMTLIVEIGDKTPSTVDIAKVAGDAWADRIITAETPPPAKTAETLPTRQVSALPLPPDQPLPNSPVR